MIEHWEKGLLALQFPNLMAFSGIRHGVFTRNGGCSPYPFQSLNVSFDVGDDKRNVERNRQVLLRYIQGNHLVFVKQNHEDHVLIFDEKNSWEDSNDVVVGDAMVTNQPHLFLTLQVADCQAILLISGRSAGTNFLPQV